MQKDSINNITDDLFDDDEVLSQDVYDESYDSFSTNNARDSGVYRVWLDTEAYLNNIFLTITNQTVKVTKRIIDNKEVSERRLVPIAEGVKPLANDIGISQIMGELKTYIDGQIAQGNLKDDRYERFMYHYCVHINRLLYSKRLAWGIKISDVQGLYHKIVGSVSIYLTRPISNLERGRENWNPNRDGKSEKSGFFDKARDKYMKRKGIGGY